MTALGATPDPDERSASRQRGDPPAHARPGEPGLGDHLRRAGARGDERVLEVVSREMWQALNTLYLELDTTDLGSAIETGPYSICRVVRERCALWWARRRDDAARPGLCLPRRRALRRGREHDVADAPGLDRPGPARRRGDGGREERRGAGAAPGDRRRRGVQALRPRPADSYPVATFLLFEQTYPHRRPRPRTVPDSLSRRRSVYRTAPPLLRLARLRAELEFHHRGPGRGRRVARLACRARAGRARRGRQGKIEQPLLQRRRRAGVRSVTDQQVSGSDCFFHSYRVSRARPRQPRRTLGSAPRRRHRTRSINDYSIQIVPKARLHRYRRLLRRRGDRVRSHRPHQKLTIEAQMHVTTHEQPIDPDGASKPFSQHELPRRSERGPAAQRPRPQTIRARRRAGRGSTSPRRRSRPTHAVEQGDLRTKGEGRAGATYVGWTVDRPARRWRGRVPGFVDLGLDPAARARGRRALRVRGLLYAAPKWMTAATTRSRCRRTPGLKHLLPNDDDGGPGPGSGSTRPTASAPERRKSRSATGAITRTCPPSAASITARR